MIPLDKINGDRKSVFKGNEGSGRKAVQEGQYDAAVTEGPQFLGDRERRRKEKERNFRVPTGITIQPGNQSKLKVV